MAGKLNLKEKEGALIYVEDKLNKLTAWQYLNVATFIGVCIIIVLLVL